MSVADTLPTPKRELLGGEFNHQSSRRGTKFYRSLRSRDYIFLVLLLAYVVLVTVFFFSQREKLLLKLEKSLDRGTFASLRQQAVYRQVG